MRLFGFGVLLVCALCACGKPSAPAATTDLPRESCQGRNDGLYCDNGEALRCDQGEVAEADDCHAAGQECVPGTGCLACAPRSYGCEGNTLLLCSADGSRYESVEECADGLACSPEGCVDLCGRAERERSYIGCDYYPVFTSNDQLDAKFQPAVVIANPNLVPADVLITRGGQQLASLQVAPGGVETVVLSYEEGLRSPAGSAIVRNGAHHLVASVPVTVHQFNPLLFELAEDCARDEQGPETPGEADDERCNSFTNDASLLLPTHALRREQGETLSYMAITRPSFTAVGAGAIASPGFLAVVATGDRPVRVKLRSSAFTLGSSDHVALPDAGDRKDASAGDAGALLDGGLEDASLDDAALALGDAMQPEHLGPDAGRGSGIPPLSPGDTLEDLTLMPGDVLQLLSAAPEECDATPVATRAGPICPLGPAYDLTGTVIEADGPVEVIAGHNCSFVPFDRIACDHLEETMFPIDTWGVEVVAPRPRSAGAQLPQVLRVVSAADGNSVSFAPAIHAPVTLGRGEMLELLTASSVVVSAQKPIAVAQYLVGQDGEGTVGDPSMSVAIPVEQYRSSYAFLSPATYTDNYVTIIAQAGDAVVLDGNPVGGFSGIADGAYQVAAVALNQSGAHEVHSARGLGIGLLVYGYGDYTSYMLPGGLDLRSINELF